MPDVSKPVFEVDAKSAYPEMVPSSDRPFLSNIRIHNPKVKNMAVETISIWRNSIVIAVAYNGQTIPCILDTGDAIGPVFNAQDAEKLQLVPTGEIGVAGAGGATMNESTTVSVSIGGLVWDNEPAAIDPNLEGLSLIGLPFFLKNCTSVSFDFENELIDLEGK